MNLTAEDLLGGGAVTHEVEVPAAVRADDGPGAGPAAGRTTVVVRPLTVRDLQRIGKAGSGDDSVSAALMIQQGLVEPPLTLEQVAQLPAGTARFLVERINEISGVDTPRDRLGDLVQAPLAKACFVLAKEFGWTPEDVSGMTIGQILLYLEMANGDES
jgi:hypothetical protein